MRHMILVSNEGSVSPFGLARGMRRVLGPVLAPMNIDYASLSGDLDSGELRERLRSELVVGFRLMVEGGDAVPPASYFATKITEIIYASRDREIEANTQYDLYQEVLLACEEARREVLGEDPPVN